MYFLHLFCAYAQKWGEVGEVGEAVRKNNPQSDADVTSLTTQTECDFSCKVKGDWI